MSLAVKPVEADKLFIDFRHKWLRPGKPRKTSFFKGDSADSTYHFAALSNEKIIGIVSYFNKLNLLLEEKKLSYQLRSMAVDQSYRHQYIGHQILNVSLAFLKSKKIDFIWCNARKESYLFYQKQGFLSVGDYFVIPDVGQHLLMYKNL